MDPNQNTPPNYKYRKPDNAFALDTTPRQFLTIESPQGGFINLLQTGKKPARPTTTQERVPWTKEEEKLAEAWVAASEDPIIGDSQPYGSFWKKLMESETRNADQIMSKWRDIRLKCTEFGGIYNNLLNIRKSGSNNFNILKTTNLFVGPLEEIKQKKAASTSSNSSVMDIFGNKFDRYVQLQETKADVMTRMEQKMIEAQSSFQEAQETLQTKTDMEFLKMKTDDLEGEDLKLFQAIKE
uniref:Myb-like domain-containing protein n=1 Tax=Lactuca sativa TaxID=4236 RepID=A0A9R1VPS8_LACSA|nr:hypothetical protein LSAT_V11C400219270 [Lactuca sativa]